MEIKELAAVSNSEWPREENLYSGNYNEYFFHINCRESYRTLHREYVRVGWQILRIM